VVGWYDICLKLFERKPFFEVFDIFSYYIEELMQNVTDEVNPMKTSTSTKFVQNSSGLFSFLPSERSDVLVK